ncbi:Glycosyltransferase involved in cell wall bisynthesis [Prosthecobacter debontii]|uniref:Glycosyltransferase involved in cell wall bisynthesis n=1 Tax=Prosthecobacter debontii TaxID=48467 RepID=A0A1T4XBD5_9BACT|nr:glycosyltransferase family 2 protein [Prosthecobacter debontii]SKA86475.1 Glycosyltransferase involved in cell wall bisynthesis [Prosthecobacter debontii]
MKILVLIPSYNTGRILPQTVRDVLKYWPDVWVVMDGSTDGSEALLEPVKQEYPGLKVIVLEKNSGKGSAVLHGTRLAQQAGYTHVLTMDADGQHPTHDIPRFTALAEKHPEAVMMGTPVFGPEAPQLRVQGRKISNMWANLETLNWGIPDTLFGMRLYPVMALLKAFRGTPWARRFDYDTEIAVRLAWHGVPMLAVPTTVRYLTKEEGGVSQFRYFRDNSVLTWMHARLLFGFAWRLPLLLMRVGRGGNPLRNLSA